jgi:ABC-type uncharacterized transport system substrate-binding protein
MKWRKISEHDIITAIQKPDDLKDTIKGRKNAFKNIENRLLRVTYKNYEDDIIIITALVKGE